MSTTQELRDLPTQYEPGRVERAIYERWIDAGIFAADEKRSRRNGGDRDPFVIVMPPPNVTSVLHMGHGLTYTVQDVIIRWRRMVGDEALWVPGTDHAGIATQNIIEKQLASEGKTKFDLGRDGFVARTIAFVEETGGEILRQLRAIGASADWNRTAYTLSPELSRAVREAFVQLYERGLIYRGHRVIHWCPRCMTSLSDEEAEHDEEMGRLYQIAYPVVGAKSNASLIVATTRPETMLGDVAVAVHPDDERYKKLIGKSVTLPIANVEIPVIADDYVDPTYGTGVLKITPAHDPNDFEVGKRHKLPMPVIMAPDGTMANGVDANARVPAELLGIDRFEARERIIRTLEKSRQLIKVESHQHAVRHCYRCDTVVEPRLSDQWFVKMEPLAKPALKAVRDGTIRILPERWEAVYINWLENIRDWNISRQLWWGHRIPVWYCDQCNEQIVSRADVTACSKCGGPLRQDEDVLDTWFSSWLFPISTLGWPDKSSAALAAFYPTDDLITAPEILFFWVSRMIMAGYAFMEAPPFHTVYLHGTVRDTNHVKMSKSLGNGIDPLDVVTNYGADALRYTVVAGMGMGADLMLDPRDLERSFAPGRNFATKLWNIGRFLLANVGTSSVRSVDELRDNELTLADRWILGRLNATILECDVALGPARPEKRKWRPEERYSGLRLSEYAESARRFVWGDVADWYLETTKGRIGAASADSEVARAVLTHVFDYALRLLHPIMPFITETLWQRLPLPFASDRCEFLAIAPWPIPHPPSKAETHAMSRFDLVREAVSAVRQIRSDYSIPPGRLMDTIIQSRVNGELFMEHSAMIGRLSRSAVKVGTHSAEGGAAHSVLVDGSEIIIPLGSLVDLSKECDKLRTELEQLEVQLTALSKRLQNEGFTSRAPANVVTNERNKEEEWTKRREQLVEKVKALCGG
ncbi:MAG: valine--tRNA ligase [Gemmatimonadetes bacterium]|nr:MAG: valine--tRNA ligase [Gemmatimonadota bacterium]PYP54596.1 MAG: valine--tRNA ligase [Gemmatimonadota bacterium]